MSSREASTIADAATRSAIAAERSYLMRMARRHLRDRVLAEDVVHDTLLAAFQSIGGYAGRSSLRTWLTAILQHRIVDALRGLRRRREVSGEPAEADDGDEQNPQYTAPAEIDHHDPLRLLEARQSVLGLIQRLQRLSPIATQVLLLRQVEGFSNDETAQRLQLAPAAVPTILHRARKRLMQLANEPAPA